MLMLLMVALFAGRGVTGVLGAILGARGLMMIVAGEAALPPLLRGAGAGWLPPGALDFGRCCCGRAPCTDLAVFCMLLYAHAFLVAMCSTIGCLHCLSLCHGGQTLSTAGRRRGVDALDSS